MAGNLSTVVIFVYFQHILELHANHGLKSLCRPFQKIQHWFDPYASSHIWSRLLEVALARLALEYDLQTCPSQSSPWGFGRFQLGQTTKHGEQNLFTNVDLLNLLETGRLKFRFGEVVDTQDCHFLVFLVYCLQIYLYQSTGCVFPLNHIRKIHVFKYIIIYIYIYIIILYIILYMVPAYHPHHGLLQRYLPTVAIQGRALEPGCGPTSQL